MRVYRVKSNVPFSDAELRKISGILRESRCPNESLSSTFPGQYRHIEEGAMVVYFGGPPWAVTQEIEV